MLRAERAPGIRSTDRTSRVAVEEEFAILDRETLELVNRFEDAPGERPRGTRARAHLVGELLTSEIEVSTGRGRALRGGGDAARRAPRPAARARGRAGTPGSHRHAPLLGLEGPADHRHAALPAGRGPAQVRGLAQQHLGGARARRRARLRPGRGRLRRAAHLPAAPARALRQLAVHRGRLDPAALGAHADLRAHVPALRHPRRRRHLGRAPALLRGARRHQLHPGVHADLVVGAAAPPRSAPSRCASATRRPRRGQSLASPRSLPLAPDRPARIDEGLPLPIRETRYVEENLWRAIRYGLSGDLLDFATHESGRARGIEELVEWVQPVAEEFRCTRVPRDAGTQLGRAADRAPRGGRVGARDLRGTGALGTSARPLRNTADPACVVKTRPRPGCLGASFVTPGGSSYR